MAINKAELKVHSIIENLGDGGLPDGDPEISITTHEGVLQDDGDSLHVIYSEDTDGGRVNCHIICYSDGRVSLSRRGAIVSDLLFAEGEEIRTVYSIPPYRFDMTLVTKKIRKELSLQGGELQLLYSMNVGGQEKRARMKITAKSLNA